MVRIRGPSGSGKSTLIRRINRLEEHQQGTIRADRVTFVDQGQIVEQNTPAEFVCNPCNGRGRDFLSKIHGH